MSQITRNDLAVPSSDYTADLTYSIPGGCLKLSIDVEAAAVYLQTSEAPHDRGHFPEPRETSESKLRAGFHSRTFVTRIYSFRFRATPAGAAVVSFVAYG